MKRSIKIFCVLCVTAAAAAVLLRGQPEPEAPGILLETADERIAWLNLRGWQTGAETQVQTQIPREWKTSAGQRWLQLQHAQGLYPEQFGGQQALRCVYPIAESDVLFAELLLCDGMLVGAQVYNAETRLMQSVR